MTRGAYYNEINPFAAQWLRNLINAGLIAPGEVDERSITDVQPDDLKGFVQCHFFAGIGGWSLALRLAGWDDSSPVWTGSCPCQPFSVAGKGKGAADERHLWPVWFDLIRECRPSAIFGEQVASAQVTGAASAAKMQGVWGGEAFQRVLLELEGQRPGLLQGLLQGRGAGAQAQQPRSDKRTTPEMATREPRKGSDESSAAPGGTAGSGVQPGPGGDTAPDRHGALRDDGPAVRSGYAEGVERAVAGSDKSGRRVHPGERAGGSVRAERDGECMGHGHDPDGCEGDGGADEHEAGERLVAECIERALAGSGSAAWLDAVSRDLEGEGYAVGSAVLGAHSVGAPHIRQRLWFVADANSQDQGGRGIQRPGEGDSAGAGAALERSTGLRTDDLLADAVPAGRAEWRAEPGRGSPAGERGLGNLGHASGAGSQVCEREAVLGAGWRGEGRAVEQSSGSSGGVADAGIERRQQIPGSALGDEEADGRTRRNGRGSHSDNVPASDVEDRRPGPLHGFWRDADWLHCRDGKWRPTQSALLGVAPGVSLGMVPCGTGDGRFFLSPLVQGAPSRVGRLRGYGNAIVPQVAAEFIRAYMECRPD